MELSREGCVQPSHSRCRRWARGGSAVHKAAVNWVFPYKKAFLTSTSQHWLTLQHIGNGGSNSAMCQHVPLLEPLQVLWNHHLCWKSSKILRACGTGSGTVLCFQMTHLMGTHVAKGSCKVLMQATQEQSFGDEGNKRVVIGSGYVHSPRQRGSDWQGLGRLLEMREEGLERRAKLNRQADYCFKIQGKYILRKKEENMWQLY